MSASSREDRVANSLFFVELEEAVVEEDFLDDLRFLEAGFCDMVD